MTRATPEQQIEDFTHENYRRLVRLARARFTFRGYTDFDHGERFVLWRHDVDMSMHSAAQLARIEAEEQVVATYFLHLHSEFYNLLEPEVTRLAHKILDLGHQIGLHFDTHYYGVECEADLERWLRHEADFVEGIFGRRLETFSLHNTTAFTMACRRMEYAGLRFVHGAYLQDEVRYCSDSNGYWRYQRLEDVLRSPDVERLQVLTHPEWWQNEAMAPKARVRRCVEGRAAATLARYEDALQAMGRPDIDAAPTRSESVE